MEQDRFEVAFTTPDKASIIPIRIRPIARPGVETLLE
jgi:hypothetical protein